MKQRDLEKETDDEQLDEDGEWCDNVLSKKVAKKRKRKQLKVRMYTICDWILKNQPNSHTRSILFYWLS